MWFPTGGRLVIPVGPPGWEGQTLHFRTISMVGGYYDDEYRRVQDEWLISKARFTVCSALTCGWKDTVVRVLHAGAKLPE